MKLEYFKVEHWRTIGEHVDSLPLTDVTLPVCFTQVTWELVSLAKVGWPSGLVEPCRLVELHSTSLLIFKSYITRVELIYMRRVRSVP